MAVITDFEDEREEPKHKRSQPSPSSSLGEVLDGPHDEILKSILDQKPPIEFIKTFVDFLGRKSDLFKDENVDKKISSMVSAAKKDVEVRKRKAEQSTLKDASKPEKRLNEAEANVKDEEVKSGPVGVKEEKATGSSNVYAPNKENGLDFERYSWTQTFLEVTINVPVPPGTKSRSVVCDIKKNHVKIGLKGEPPIVNGELFQSVKVDDCFWSIEDQKFIAVILTKQKKMGWWKCLVKGEPEIDIQKLERGTTSLSDLDPETRNNVEKIMYDQRQQSMNLPTSDQMQNQEGCLYWNCIIFVEFLRFFFLTNRQLEACAHPFFDELQEPNTRLPNGRPLPTLFNFKQELLALHQTLCKS